MRKGLNMQRCKVISDGLRINPLIIILFIGDITPNSCLYLDKLCKLYSDYDLNI
jgi:hypothetical protein